MSASSRPTTSPRRARATARFTLTEDLPTPPLPEATASTLVRRREVGRHRPVLGLEACLRHERGALALVHDAGADLDARRHPRAPSAGLDVGAQLISKRAGGDREGDLHPHASRLDLDRAHHAELDDVAAELGIDHPGRGPSGTSASVTLAGARRSVTAVQASPSRYDRA